MQELSQQPNVHVMQWEYDRVNLRMEDVQGVLGNVFAAYKAHHAQCQHLYYPDGTTTAQKQQNEIPTGLLSHLSSICANDNNVDVTTSSPSSVFQQETAPCAACSELTDDHPLGVNATNTSCQDSGNSTSSTHYESLTAEQRQQHNVKLDQEIRNKIRQTVEGAERIARDLKPVFDFLTDHRYSDDQKCYIQYMIYLRRQVEMGALTQEEAYDAFLQSTKEFKKNGYKLNQSENALRSSSSLTKEQKRQQRKDEKKKQRLLEKQQQQQQRPMQ